MPVSSPALLRIDPDRLRCTVRRRAPIAGEPPAGSRTRAREITPSRLVSRCGEAAVRPVPFRALEPAVAVEVEIVELDLACEARLRADHFEAAQDAVAVAIERAELGGAAMPFVALDAAVVVAVEIVEVVAAVVVQAFTEELRQIDRVVAIAIDAAERLDVEVPFVRRQPAVAVVIEVGEVGCASNSGSARSGSGA